MESFVEHPGSAQVLPASYVRFFLGTSRTLAPRYSRVSSRIFGLAFRLSCFAVATNGGTGRFVSYPAASSSWESRAASSVEATSWTTLGVKPRALQKSMDGLFGQKDFTSIQLTPCSLANRAPSSTNALPAPLPR